MSLWYLSCAPCWTVHPWRAPHLDLVTVGPSALVSVAAALHWTFNQWKLKLEKQKGVKIQVKLEMILVTNLGFHKPVWSDWRGSSGCPGQTLPLASSLLPACVHCLLSSTHSERQKEEGCWNDKCSHKKVWRVSRKDQGYCLTVSKSQNSPHSLRLYKLYNPPGIGRCGTPPYGDEGNDTQVHWRK